MQDGVGRGYGDVKNEVHIQSIMDVGSFDLEQVGGMPD
jgi:hypothetical protein